MVFERLLVARTDCGHRTMEALRMQQGIGRIAGPRSRDRVLPQLAELLLRRGCWSGPVKMDERNFRAGGIDGECDQANLVSVLCEENDVGVR